MWKWKDIPDQAMLIPSKGRSLRCNRTELQLMSQLYYGCALQIGAINMALLMAEQSFLHPLRQTFSCRKEQIHISSSVPLNQECIWAYCWHWCHSGWGWGSGGWKEDCGCHEGQARLSTGTWIGPSSCSASWDSGHIISVPYSADFSKLSLLRLTLLGLTSGATVTNFPTEGLLWLRVQHRHLMGLSSIWSLSTDHEPESQECLFLCLAKEEELYLTSREVPELIISPNYEGTDLGYYTGNLCTCTVVVTK